MQVGEIQKNVVDFIEKQGIKIDSNEIYLTRKKVGHALRDNKNPKQKLSVEQLKRIEQVIQKNDVYFDLKKQNIIFVDTLPDEEIKENRNWVKFPVNLYKHPQVATACIVPEESIIKSKEIKKIE